MLERVWEGSAVEENNLTQSISTLRKVLGKKRGENRHILTDPGKGYRFVASVSAIEPAAATVPADPVSYEPDEKPSRHINGVQHMNAAHQWRAWIAAVATLCIAVGIGLAVWLHYRSAGGTRPSRHSVAVLRIRDLSQASNQAWMQTALS
jgi:hypothetical protein